MNQLQFSPSVTAAYTISGVLMCLIPVMLCIVWKVRTHAKLLPVIIGAVIFPVFALGLKMIPAYPLFLADSDLARTVNATPWLYYLLAGILAGVFEETGRFVAFRFLLKRHTDRKTAISYGIGHGGIESIYIGVNMLSIAVLTVLINRNLLDAQTMQALPAEQLEAIATVHPGMTALGILERISAITLHIGLSVLVFGAVRKPGAFWLYPAAVLLHAAVDFCVLFSSRPILFELLFLLVSVGILLIALFAVYRRIPAQEEAVS